MKRDLPPGHYFLGFPNICSRLHRLLDNSFLLSLEGLLRLAVQRNAGDLDDADHAEEEVDSSETLFR